MPACDAHTSTDHILLVVLIQFVSKCALSHFRQTEIQSKNFLNFRENNFVLLLINETVFNSTQHMKFHFDVPYTCILYFYYHTAREIDKHGKCPLRVATKLGGSFVQYAV
ncbi:hypothetical protein T03_10849 [Trichinella britovi]|uniref:Uncharacterized protein n=1 Tax=Trichinella britovi TaxID=45882 RepID=A0A0V1CTS6_TRIBR|nr:hypothetical protein T03_10849 [Trichinella britovi]